MKKELIPPQFVLPILGALVIGLGIVGFLYYTKYTESAVRGTRIANLETTERELSDRIATLEGELAIARGENTELSSNLDAEKERNDAFEDQIDDISGTVGILDKLSKTDKELLQKYSKVSFLNEHYIPSELAELDAELLQNKDKDQYFHKKAIPFLEDMIEDAADDGVILKIISAYRSFETQRGLKSAYSVTYGSGANAFSADQGFSEHQLGTTVDLTTPAIGGTYTSFETDAGYKWLLENAHKYGFVLSYPKNNAYYIFEPWHWRFVGTELARDLHDDGKSFYDLEQREIDKYLISIFD